MTVREPQSDDWLIGNAFRLADASDCQCQAWEGQVGLCSSFICINKEGLIPRQLDIRSSFFLDFNPSGDILASPWYDIALEIQIVKETCYMCLILKSTVIGANLSKPVSLNG